MYKVAIISCGMIANAAHIPAYKHLPDHFEIVGVCDINEKAAKETAERHHIKNFYTNAEEMLKKLKPDIVSVCVPNCFHKEYVMLALSHNAHVLCEKPVAFQYKDAMEMYSFAQEKGKYLIGCQSMRFTPDRLAVKKMIENGELDEIYYAEFSRIRRRGIPTWGTFHMKKISCGGAFIDIGVHIVDALVWLMGNPKIRSVSATTFQNHATEIGNLVESGALTGEVHHVRTFHPEEMDVEDFACGSMTFENGARANFKVAWATNLPEEASIKLISKKAGVDIPAGKIYKGKDTVEELKTEENKYKEEAFFGHFYLVDNLLKVLKGEEDLIVKPEEIINVAAILECFYKSAELGREIHVKELEAK